MIISHENPFKANRILYYFNLYKTKHFTNDATNYSIHDVICSCTLFLLRNRHSHSSQQVYRKKFIKKKKPGNQQHYPGCIPADNLSGSSKIIASLCKHLKGNLLISHLLGILFGHCPELPLHERGHGLKPILCFNGPFRRELF